MGEPFHGVIGRLSKCDCCGRGGRVVVVAASCIGPMSMAYCEECIRENAEPEWGFHYLYDHVATRGEGLDEFIMTLQTYRAGEGYIFWDQWVEWRRDPARVATLDALADEQNREMAEELVEVPEGAWLDDEDVS